MEPYFIEFCRITALVKTTRITMFTCRILILYGRLWTVLFDLGIAVQAIERKEKTCEISLEELMDMFNVIKSEYSLKTSVVVGSSDVLLMGFNSPACLTSDNYYALMDLNRRGLDNLCLYLPLVSLKNTQNRTPCTAVACLLIKYRLGINNQVLATLFSFSDGRTVARTIHSARKVLVRHFVPQFLGF